jgi:hypothetical protein
MLFEWLEALHHWSVAAYLRRSLYVYPFVNATHILGIALLVGSIVPVDLRILGLASGPPLGPTARALARFAATGLALAIMTGFLLFSVQPLEYAVNPAFWTKVSLVALGTLNALALRASKTWRVAEIDGEIGTGLKIGAAISLLIWISAVFAGRAIAFLQ